MSYMIKIIILVSLFLVIVYIYSFIKIKKNKTKTFDSVQEYHNLYLNHKSLSERRKNNVSNYITKYNSTIDYKDKEDI